MALVVVATVTVFAAGFLQFTALRARGQSLALDRKRAFYLAEAGLAESYAGLRIGKTGVVGTQADPAAFGAGLFWVEATELSEDILSLDSTGMVGRAQDGAGLG